VAILGSNPDGSDAILVGSAGIGAAILHYRPHSLCVTIVGSNPDGSPAIAVGSAGVGASLLHQRPQRLSVSIQFHSGQQ